MYILCQTVSIMIFGLRDDDKTVSIDETAPERDFPASYAPKQCDVGYPCIICEADCKVFYFSNRSPEWTPLVQHRLRFVTDEQMLKITTAIHEY